MKKTEFTGTKSVKKVSYPLKGIIKADEPIQNRIMVGIPVTGLIRIEWAMARYGQVIPCNWAHSDVTPFIDQYSPMGFMVADARNLVATKAVEGNFEWLLFIDHDVVLPPHTILTMNQYMLSAKYPVVSGLYFTKGMPSEPLIYRGNGTSYYRNWKLGDKVWVDGVPMGCTLIHVSLLKVMYEKAETYYQGPNQVRRIFRTPSRVYTDPQGHFYVQAGTEDLTWCDEVIKTGVLKKAGWTDIARKKYPFLIDTNLFCRHIDNNGIQYPINGEEKEFTDGI